MKIVSLTVTKTDLRRRKDNKSSKRKTEQGKIVYRRKIQKSFTCHCKTLTKLACNHGMTSIRNHEAKSNISIVIIRRTQRLVKRISQKGYISAPVSSKRKMNKANNVCKLRIQLQMFTCLVSMHYEKKAHK